MLISKMSRSKYVRGGLFAIQRLLQSPALCVNSPLIIPKPQNLGLLVNKMSSGCSSRIRSFSTEQEDTSKLVYYEDIITYKDKPNVLFIDVREPQELEKTGVFPACINIPMGDLDKALNNSSAEEFKNKYGRNLPNKNSTELVFTCQIGVRAKKAMDIAIQMGYQNSKFYKGSWVDYVNKQQQQ